MNKHAKNMQKEQLELKKESIIDAFVQHWCISDFTIVSEKILKNELKVLSISKRYM